MRSEKEIKEYLLNKELDDWQDRKGICKWFLEGESRYSVNELLKIGDVVEENLGDSDAYIGVREFLSFIQNSEKVEKILNE